jgi:hypothetical protein
MVTVSQAAEHFINVLVNKLKPLRTSPPSRQTLRQILLDWCAQIPLDQVKEYILADFDNNLDLLYQTVVAEESDDEITEHKQHNHKSTPETTAYLSFTPQPSTYIHFLQNELTQHIANQDSFFQVLSALLSPPPSTYSKLDNVLLLEVQFNALFDVLLRHLPTIPMNTNTQDHLSNFSQILLPAMFAYLHLLPVHPNHHHTSTLAKAITSLCLLVPPPKDENGFLWLESLFSAIQIHHTTIDLSYVIVDTFTIWSHFILTPSLFSQSMNFTATFAELNALQDQKYTLLTDQDFELFEQTTLFSPWVLNRIAPYFTHLVPILSPQNGIYPNLYVVPRLVGGLLLVFSMFSHIGTVLRFYNTPQYSEIIDLVQLKTNLISLAKQLQVVSALCEAILLPIDIQNSSVRIIELIKKAELKREYRRQKAILMKEHKDAKKVKAEVNGDDSDGDVDNFTPKVPLLSAIIPAITTFKDLLSNATMQLPLFPLTTIPFSRSHELIIVFLQKSHGSISSTAEFAELAKFVGGKVTDLRTKKQHESNEARTKLIALHKKHKWLQQQKAKIRWEEKKQQQNAANNAINGGLDNQNGDKMPEEMDEDELKLVEQQKQKQLAKKARNDRLRKEADSVAQEIKKSKQNALSGLLTELVQEAKRAGEDSDDEFVPKEQQTVVRKVAGNDENQNDGEGISFEDEAYGGLADTLLGAFKSRNADELDTNDFENDFAKKDNQDISNIVNESLYEFKMHNPDDDDDDFGQIEILQ